MSLCDCPNEPSLQNIADFDCPIDFSEISKLIISRKRIFQGIIQPPTVVTLATLTEWAVTLAAVDDTKTLVTPVADDVESAPGEPITEELTVRNIVTGLDPTTFTGFIAGALPATIANFKLLTCEKILFVYFIDNDGNIIHALNGTVPEGFKVSNNSFFMQDTELIKRTINKNRFGFQLEAGWSDTAIKTTPADFDALVDLTN